MKYDPEMAEQEKPRGLWVVEMRHEGKGKWYTTVGVQLNRNDARRILKDWQTRNPNDKFRLQLYENRT